MLLIWGSTAKLSADMTAVSEGEGYLNRLHPVAAYPGRLMLLKSVWMLLICYQLTVSFFKFFICFRLVKSLNVS